MIDLELDDIFSSELCDSVVYAPVADDPEKDSSVTCYVIIERDVAIQPSDINAQSVDIGTTIQARYSDVATPQKGSTFTFGSIVFTVQRVQDNNKIIVKLIVTESEVS